MNLGRNNFEIMSTTKTIDISLSGRVSELVDDYTAFVASSSVDKLTLSTPLKAIARVKTNVSRRVR